MEPDEPSRKSVRMPDPVLPIGDSVSLGTFQRERTGSLGAGVLRSRSVASMPRHSANTVAGYTSLLEFSGAWELNAEAIEEKNKAIQALQNQIQALNNQITQENRQVEKIERILIKSVKDEVFLHIRLWNDKKIKPSEKIERLANFRFHNQLPGFSRFLTHILAEDGALPGIMREQAGFLISKEIEIAKVRLFRIGIKNKKEVLAHKFGAVHLQTRQIESSIRWVEQSLRNENPPPPILFKEKEAIENYCKEYGHQKQKENIEFVSYEEVIKHILEQGLSPAHARMTAKTLIRARIDVFSQIQSEEIESGAWKAGKNHDRAPNISEMIRMSNLLTSFVQGQILLDPDRGSTQRANVIKFWIAVAKECLNRHSFQDAFDVYLGIAGHSVASLKKVWDKLDKDSLSFYEELQDLFDLAHNFINYRNRMASTKRAHIPLLGVYLKDIVPAEESNNNDSVRKSVAELSSKVSQVMVWKWFREGKSSHRDRVIGLNPAIGNGEGVFSDEQYIDIVDRIKKNITPEMPRKDRRTRKT